MGFLSVDGTAIVQIVNLIVFILILNAVYLRPVGRAIAKRRAYLDGLARDIETADADVRGLRAQAEEKRLAARRDAEASIQRGRAEGQGEAERIGAEAAERAGSIADAARTSVAQELAAARADEPRVVDDLSRLMVERALGPGVSA